MTSNIENSDRQNDLNKTEPREYDAVVKVIKVVIVAIFLLPLAEYFLITKIDSNQIENVEIPKELREGIVETKGNNDNGKISQVDKAIQKSYKIILLDNIVKDLIEKSQLCSPNDFYAIDKSKITRHIRKKDLKIANTERREVPVPPIVNYAIATIFLVLLAAALLELYKAKRHPVKKDGFKPAPLHRQYSFPVGPSSLPIMGTSNRNLPMNGRRQSIQSTTRYVPVVDGRPAAVLQGRRHSIISDGRQSLIAVESDTSLSIDGRGIFLTDRTVDHSHERRFYGHSRRVHRH